MFNFVPKYQCKELVEWHLRIFYLLPLNCRDFLLEDVCLKADKSFLEDRPGNGESDDSASSDQIMVVYSFIPNFIPLNLMIMC